MPVKFTPFILSVSLASPMILGDRPLNTLAETPLHTHELPRVPSQTVSVSSPAISGSNVAAQSYTVDAYVADADLVLPLDGLRRTTDRRAGTANLCTVYTGEGTAYVVGVPLPVRLRDKVS